MSEKLTVDAILKELIEENKEKNNSVLEKQKLEIFNMHKTMLSQFEENRHTLAEIKKKKKISLVFEILKVKMEGEIKLKTKKENIE